MSSFKERIKNNPWSAIIIIVLLILLAFKILSTVNNNRRELFVKAENWDKLMLVLSEIDNNYVDSINKKGITEKIIPYILESLDPHSIYLPPQELKDADEILEGNFDGIGIQFNVPNDTAIVISVITGGPSERAGLLSGDRIVQVNKETVAGIKMPQDSLVKRLRGKSGSVVNVGIKRGNSNKLVNFDIKRDRIPVKSIDVAYMVDDNTGYIKLSKFSRTSHKEFLEAVKDLKNDGMKDLIFDLRGNNGGYFDQAFLLANEFLKKGELIVYMEGLHRKRQDFFADNNGTCNDIGLKVLIDEGSASSSEIFAGAIQDNDRGVVIGRRSFGKGLVQEPINFTDKSGIRLTVARFYTPTGRSIQKPYSKDYQYDILERYKHGEMSFADSIRKNDSLKFTTPKGKIVYGGGGITPDIFVPVDTVGVNDFFIKASNQGLAFKFSSLMADEYRPKLKDIKDIKSLNMLFSSIDFEKRFLIYAATNNLKPKNGEWSQCRDVILTQIKALVGRYSPLDDEAFYPIMAEIDKVMKIATEQ
ncbi:MAG: S41 family peptidase [Rikenellaceae bacterium]